MEGAVEAFVTSYLRDTASCSDREWACLCSEQQEGLAQLRALAAGQAQASVQASLVAAVQQHQAREYESEAARVRECLDHCGIHLDGLSAHARLSVQLMVRLCSALGVAQPRITSVLAAWVQLLLRESHAAVLRGKLEQQASQLRRNRAAAEERMAELQQALAEVRDAQAVGERSMQQETRNVVDLNAKDVEYQHTLAKFAKKLASNNVQPYLHHSSLVAKQHDVAELQGRLAEMQARLEGYHNLPASMLGAQMMLKQAKERLQASQERLEAGLAHL